MGYEIALLAVIAGGLLWWVYQVGGDDAKRKIASQERSKAKRIKAHAAKIHEEMVDASDDDIARWL